PAASVHAPGATGSLRTYLGPRPRPRPSGPAPAPAAQRALVRRHRHRLVRTREPRRPEEVAGCDRYQQFTWPNSATIGARKGSAMLWGEHHAYVCCWRTVRSLPRRDCRGHLLLGHFDQRATYVALRAVCRLLRARQRWP